MHRILILLCALGACACILTTSVQRDVDLRFLSSVSLDLGAEDEAGDLRLTNRGSHPVRVTLTNRADSEGLEQPVGIAEIEPAGAWELEWEGAWRVDLECLGGARGRVAVELEGSPRATLTVLGED